VPIEPHSTRARQRFLAPGIATCVVDVERLYSFIRMKRTIEKSLVKSARLFKAFSDPVRLRLLNLLWEREVCVCHLHGALQLPQPTVSRHLAYLRRTGLVVGRKEGLWVHYRAAKPSSNLHRSLLSCLGCLDESEVLKKDRERLGQLIC
jgi:ArsR family transcriptional regulator, arsenate/arsenite/antimonite-responsive transcriptional repressor